MVGPVLGSPLGTPSCDRCRNRKVKCIPLAEEDLVIARNKGVGNRCKGCYKADKECTHNYIHKKPGRPLGSGRSARTISKSASGLQTPSISDDQTMTLESSAANSLLSPTERGESGTLASTASSFGAGELFGMLGDDGVGPASGSIFGSARNALYQGYAYPPTFGAPLWETELVPASNVAPPKSPENTIGDLLGTCMPLANQAQGPWSKHTTQLPSGNAAQVSPMDHPSNGSIDLSGELDANDKAYEHGARIEDAIPWSDMCFFVSLFLHDQHCLVGFVHKPTFAQDIISRRDEHDEAFRGQLFSIVAYTISQCPISTMTGKYERPRLAALLHRCRTAADAVRHRQRLVPSLPLLASTTLDWITAQAVGLPQVADLLVSEVTRLVHALNLTSTHPPVAGSNRVDLEVARRLFWVIYAKDKTDAMSGRPIILPDFEGVAPLPLEVDDDFITTEGSLPQPAGKTSYMCGFAAVSRIFQVVSHCITRQRSFANSTAYLDRTGMGLDMDPGPNNTDTLMKWIETAQQRLHDVLDGLPPELKASGTERDGAYQALSPSASALGWAGASPVEGGRPSANNAIFGIQQANITITALCAEFALLDFRASLRPEQDTRGEREDMARNAYATLASIPIEQLAANGESMRGKVLRIILTLLSMSPEPMALALSQNIWDWWNMYSRVQFLQVIPDQDGTMMMLEQARITGSSGPVPVAPSAPGNPPNINSAASARGRMEGIMSRNEDETSQST